jgi:subtilisin family serine protease
MERRRTIWIIVGVAVGLLALAAGAILVMNRNIIGETVSSLVSTPIPPVPSAIGGVVPTDSGQAGGTATPGSVATPQIMGTFQAKVEGLKLDPPPSFDELVEKYPELGPLLVNLNLDDEEKLESIYAELVKIYKLEGFGGMQVVVQEAGILEALNLDSAYFDFIVAYEEQGVDGAVEMARERGLINQNDELRVIVILDTEDTGVLEPTLSQLHGRVLQQYGTTVEIGIPIEWIKEIGSSKELLFKMVELAHLEHVVGVQAPELTKPNDVFSAEGPGVTGANVWHNAGITGRGIKVGVIDPDGFNGYLNLLGNTLPPSELVHIFPEDAQFLNGSTGSHGTACAEIVHDMAPDAELYLAYSYGTEGGLGGAIDWMLANDVKIISYSASSLVGPKDGKGSAAEMVKKATDRGVLWVNSSGNYAQTHLKMPFSDTDHNGWHEFPDGDEIMRIYPGEGGTAIGLSWNDVLNGATQNYDLYVLTPKPDGSGYDTLVSERSAQSGRASDHPFELLFNEFSPGGEYYLAIRAVNSSAPTQFNLLGDGVEFPYWMVDGSLGSPADSPDVLTVGATNWQTDALEDYSSQGPTDDGRLKPEISAPAGVSSSVYGEFFGTSASAPHVAGAAALVWNAYPTAGTSDIRDYLLQNALDLGPPGMDNGFGAGRLALPAPPAPGEQQSQPSGPPTFTISSIWQEHNAIVSGIKGMNIHIVFEAKNFQNQPGSVTASFFTQDGQPLADSNGSFANGAGQAAVSEKFTPLYEPTLYSDFILFMPYSELEVGEGDHQLQFQITVNDDATGQVVATTELFPFNYQQETSIQPIVVLKDVKVKHNQKEDGVNGMRILVSFDISNFGDQEGEVAAYFYFRDVSNRRLKDYDGYYQDPNGYVAMGLPFKPGYNNTSFDNLEMFMPYRQLHLVTDEHYDLKFQIVIWDRATGNELARSDWVNFWYEP